MGCAAKLPVHGPFIFRNFPAMEPELFYRVKACIREHLSLHDIELAATACTCRIVLVTGPCRPQCAPLVKKGRSELGRNRIAGPSAATLAQRFAGVAILAVRIAALDHEIADNPVKKQAVIKAGLRQ